MVEKKENKAIKKVTKKVTKAKQEPVEPQYFAKDFSNFLSSTPSIYQLLL